MRTLALALALALGASACSLTLRIGPAPKSEPGTEQDEQQADLRSRILLAGERRYNCYVAP